MEPYKPKRANTHPWKRAWNVKQNAKKQEERRDKEKKEPRK